MLQIHELGPQSCWHPLFLRLVMDWPSRAELSVFCVTGDMHNPSELELWWSGFKHSARTEMMMCNSSTECFIDVAAIPYESSWKISS